MSRIENQSIFGNYSQNENRVTAALLQILKQGGTNFISKVFSSIDEIEFPSNEINIITQEKEDKNVYDGILSCDFSFRILVESKIKIQSIPLTQLNGLIQNARNSYDYILYITPDNFKPEILETQKGKIYWANWKKINETFKSSNDFTEPLNFLINEFEKYLEFLGLLENITKEERVQIVAGAQGEPRAIKYGIYACQNNRPTQESNHLAFYNRGGIHTLFKIKNGPINNVDLKKVENQNMANYLTEFEPFYNSEFRQYYELELVTNNLTIKNDTIDKNGKNTAYTMGIFRYTKLENILKAKLTSEL
jgi:hypothetical protein